MIADGLKPGVTGKLITRLGFNRYDVTIGHPLRDSAPGSKCTSWRWGLWISKIEAAA